jgi:hypothetical protein
MKRARTLRQRRPPAVRAWVGAALVAVLLLAEAFAVAHPLDAAAHTDGQPCTICLSAHALGAGAASTPPSIDFPVAAQPPTVPLAAVHVRAALARPHARGPPAVSFAS